MSRVVTAVMRAAMEAHEGTVAAGAASPLVGKVGLEPTRPEGLRILSPMRLPISPLPRGGECTGERRISELPAALGRSEVALAGGSG